MLKYALAAALAAGIPSLALAQTTSPDGSRPFGLEPYVGVLGGYHSFDRASEFGQNTRYGKPNGYVVGAVAGANVPFGPVFVGAEGNVSKNFNDLDWEYGVKGRAGFRAGESGLLFVSAGYQWVNGRHGFGDKKDVIYGGGIEVGPKDIGLAGLTGNSGIRLRLQAETYDFDSIKPMAGVVFHF